MTRMLEEDIPPDVRVRIHNNLGSFYHDRLGDPAEGREHFRLAAETAEASQMGPMNFFHWRVYAWVALRDHQWQEALDAASHILDTAPTDFERRNLHVLIAAAKANLHQPEEALSHLQAASTPGPEPPEAEGWPFQVPPETDPLDWARKNRGEYFSSVADEREFSEILASD